MRHVGHKQVHRVIRVDRPERVLAQPDRQPRALRRPGRVRIARRRPPPPHVARALAVRDEHAQRRHGGEHRERVPLRLVERELLLLRVRVDREARRGRGRVLVLVLVHGEVQRRPDKDLQLRKVFLDDAQYALVLPRRLQRAIIHTHEQVRLPEGKGHAYIIYVFVNCETGQVGRLFRECTEDARGRQVLPGQRGLPRERQALEIPAHIPERARGAILLLHRDKPHVEPQRDRLRLLLAPREALKYVRRDAQIPAAQQRRVRRRRREAHLPARVAVVLERGELRLRREPLRERLAPREHAVEALEAERAAVQDPRVVAADGPRARARPRQVDRRGDREVLQVHEQLHHPRHHLRIARLGLPVHRARVRQALHAAREVGPREHRAAEEEQSPFGHGDVFVKVALYVVPERAGHETEAVIEVEGVYELQDGQEKLGR